MKKSYIADNIMKEYKEKKKYSAKTQKDELQNFIVEYCTKCKNNNTKLCHIIKNIDNKFSCPFKNL